MQIPRKQPLLALMDFQSTGCQFRAQLVQLESVDYYLLNRPAEHDK